MMDTTPGRAWTTTSAAAPQGWFDAVAEVQRAWLSANACGCAALASAFGAQVAVAGQVMRVCLAAATPLDRAGTSLLRDSLLLTEGEGERIADAARQTLKDLAPTPSFLPLPE